MSMCLLLRAHPPRSSPPLKLQLILKPAVPSSVLVFLCLFLASEFLWSSSPLDHPFCHLFLCCLLLCCSVAKSCLTLRDLVDCSTPAFPVLCYLPEFAQIHVHWVGDAIQQSHPLSPLLPLPSVFASIRVFSSESGPRIRWPEYWSFSISPSNEYSGLISFRTDWFGLVSLLSKGLSNTIIQRHQFFLAQPSLWFNSHIHTWLLKKP